MLGNLSKVLDLLWDARAGWFNLGLALGIDHTTLTVIKQDNGNQTESCFTEMLSVWLKMCPPPTWETLIAKLKARSVGKRKLAKQLEKQLGLALDSDELNGMPYSLLLCLVAVGSASESVKKEFILGGSYEQNFFTHRYISDYALSRPGPAILTSTGTTPSTEAPPPSSNPHTTQPQDNW